MPEEADNLTQLKGNIEDLLAALPRLAIAASKDDTRPLLGGIAVEFDEDRDALDLVATDTYRLAVYRSTVNAFQGKVIWPARCVTNIAKVLGHSPVVHVGGRHSYFASARMLCFVRNIEGQYVKWRPLFHNGDGWSWSFDPKVEHPNMVAMAKATPHLPVRFDFSAGTEQTTSQEGIGVQGKMSGTFTETDLKLGLNPTYFAEAMQIVGGDEVVARGIDNLKPVILTGEPRWEVLQMPI
jgi:DNA polymerase-3 subunit beta